MSTRTCNVHSSHITLVTLHQTQVITIVLRLKAFLSVQVFWHITCLPAGHLCVRGLHSHGDCDYSPEGCGPVCCRARQLVHRLVPDETNMGQPRSVGQHGAEDDWRQYVQTGGLLTFKPSVFLYIWLSLSYSPREAQSKEPVGEDWCCGHGCAATWMIIVQRGRPWQACVVKEWVE